MPYRKYGAAKKAKRPYRRPYKKVKKAKRGYSLSIGMPLRKLVKMRYCDKVSVDAAASGDVAHYYFRSNSIFDPDYTGTGHQPFGHDQWALLYNHYVVLGAKITVKFTNTANGVGDALIVGIMNRSHYDTSTTNLTQITEQNKVRYRTMTPWTGSSRSMTCKFSTKKFFNVVNVKDNLARLGATFGANPTELAYFDIFCGSADASNLDNPAAVNLFVIVDYIVALSEPKNLAQS